jgi:ABC-2 type transport system ATP-binding protein
MKKGKLMASGSVGSILSNDKIIEVSCTNNDRLLEFLKSTNLAKSIESKPGFFECTVDQSTEIAQLSESLYQNGFIILHLVVRKQKLEEEFLQIVNKS